MPPGPGLRPARGRGERRAPARAAGRRGGRLGGPRRSPLGAVIAVAGSGARRGRGWRMTGAWVAGGGEQQAEAAEDRPLFMSLASCFRQAGRWVLV